MIYYMCCTIENNNCPKKEECKRYLNAKDNSCMTLFKYACTEENDYLLFMKQEETTEVISINEKQDINKDIKKERDDNINE